MGEDVGEAAGDLEHVARLVEDHESPRGAEVLKPDLAAEFARIDAGSGCPADLHRPRAPGTANLEHLRDRDTEGILVDSGQIAVPRDRQQLGTCGLGGADGAIPIAPHDSGYHLI